MLHSDRSRALTHKSQGDSQWGEMARSSQDHGIEKFSVSSPPLVLVFFFHQWEALCSFAGTSLLQGGGWDLTPDAMVSFLPF
jgi:hypothetical protein